MSQVLYTVRCTFEDPDVQEAWLHWLREVHAADLLRAGAIRAEVVRLDGDPPTCEAHYLFPSREVFDRYEADHAPRLRAEGLRRFPLSLGLTYERRVGEIEVSAAPA